MSEGQQLTVRVRLMGFLRTLSLGGEVHFQGAPGTSVGQLLQWLTERGDERLAQALLDRQGRLNGGLQVIVDGKLVAPKQVDGYPLHEDGTVMIMPMLGGGAT